MYDERAANRDEYIAGYQRYCAESAKMKKASIKFHRVSDPSVREFVEFEIVKRNYREECQKWKEIQQKCFMPLENVSLEDFISSKRVIEKLTKEKERATLLDPDNKSEIAKLARAYQAQENNSVLDRSLDPDYEYDEEQDLYVKKRTKENPNGS